MSDEFRDDDLVSQPEVMNEVPQSEPVYVAQEKPVRKKKGKKIFLGVLASLLLLAAGGGIFYGVSTLVDNHIEKNSEKEAEDEDTKATLHVADNDTSDKKEDEKNTESTTATASKTSLTVAQTVTSTSQVSATLLDVSGIVEEVMPSVVAVTNSVVYKVTSNNWSWFGSSQNYEYPASGAGSGVIIGQNETELLIVTNAHVVVPTDYSKYGYSVDSNDISIEFCEGTSVEAYVKGYDEDADLAVVGVKLDNINSDTLSAIKIATVGNSDELKPGNGVIAIGNALGFGQSVTVGYVSALNRSVTIDNVTRTLLQTDAAINPGNSGGGLFNTNGELVGINSAKYTSEDVEGIGYAIPITSAAEKIEELMNKVVVVREKVTDEDKMCYLGIYSSDRYTSNYGVVIGGVVEEGPAEKAGLSTNDIIFSVGGKSVSSWSDLTDVLAYYEGGESVEISFYTIEGSGRNQQYVEKTVEVLLGFKKDMPEE